jgi:hypothetical protein
MITPLGENALMTNLPTQPPEKSSNSFQTVVRVIGEGLRGSPEYLLIFGLIALFLLLFVAGLAAGKIEADASLRNFLLALFVTSMGAMLAVVYLRERRARQEPSQPERQAYIEIAESTVTVHPFSDAVAAIERALKTAQKYDHPVFGEALKHSVAQLVKTAKDLGRGTFTDTDNDADATLRAVYEDASQTIFATSVPEYFYVWRSPFGQNLLDVHASGKAQVTRLFIFNARTDITSEVIAELDKQIATGRITIHVFVDDDAEDYDYPAELSKDFTIVDEGRVLGVTITYGERSRAQWFFDDEDRSKRYGGVRDQLIMHSYKYARLKEIWQSDQEKRPT